MQKCHKTIIIEKDRLLKLGKAGGFPLRRPLQTKLFERCSTAAVLFLFPAGGLQSLRNKFYRESWYKLMSTQHEYTAAEIKEKICESLVEQFSVRPENAPNAIYYKACANVVREILREKKRNFKAKYSLEGRKRIYYMCIEFLLGRSLKNNIYNLKLAEPFQKALQELGVKLENLYEHEPDAGLGNGGLGRLAACFMDALATTGYPAMGYSILYEFGIFKQKIVDGWQTELPDNWLPGGDVWLMPRPEIAVDVHFGGQVDEFWDKNYHHVSHKNYTTVTAVPYDMYISGYDSDAVSVLRLWKAESQTLDMASFNRGDYTTAVGTNFAAELISKVLYPNDNHPQGKALRLRQQYFLVAASMQDIIRRHMDTYGTLENFAEKNAIHINDTHPTLAIPELMRILMDDCGYSWDDAWEVVSQTFAYTNHTVMSEALERWNEEMFRELLPRIHQIIHEINEQFCQELFNKHHKSMEEISRMAICADHQIRMANLCVAVCHSVNGVSKLHSEIIKDDLFKDFAQITPQKFKNVTNGIASRRWLYQSNPELTALIEKLIGEDFLKDLSNLTKLNQYLDDKKVLNQLTTIKNHNKKRFAAYMLQNYGVAVNTDSIFDVQVKRLHEYKRQHLNALHIISLYQQLLDNPEADITPRTFIFGAKAAPGYHMAKQIISLLCTLSKEIEKNPVISKKLQVVYMEDYRVTLSELLMPAADVSEQISLAGTEASGTGNMKLMLNGAITLGTLDGANVEIREQVGDENIVIFGMKTEEVNVRKTGYNPQEIYHTNPVVKRAIDLLYAGIGGKQFVDIANSLVYNDPYMVLADFESYRQAQQKIEQLYNQKYVWNRMSLKNIAQSGIFCSDRSIRDYANTIWHLN